MLITSDTLDMWSKQNNRNLIKEIQKSLPKTDDFVIIDSKNDTYTIYISCMCKKEDIIDIKSTLPVAADVIRESLKEFFVDENVEEKVEVLFLFFQ